MFLDGQDGHYEQVGKKDWRNRTAGEAGWSGYAGVVTSQHREKRGSIDKTKITGEKWKGRMIER
jgi:hypothetical protein